MHRRLPRFKRASNIAPIHLTDRDREIILLVHHHRFLRSSQIAALLGDRSQQLLRRLQLLYHHGYLERPRAQIDYYHQGGSRHIVYGLGNKGMAFLRKEGSHSTRGVRWGEKNRAVGRIFLEHALLVSEVMVTIELACRQSGRVRLLPEHELPLPAKTAQKRQSFRWKVKINSQLQLGIVPDRVFALEYEDEWGKKERVFFFLEADRGTMPVIRHNLCQTSFWRKLLAYEATWSQSLHRSLFGFHRFRVLTVTKSPERVASLVNACSQLARGHGLFLFADQSVLQNPDLLFSPVWRTGRAGESAKLLP